ncbi:hypothetical protein [Chitinolyticbacter meiyuanensis]|uniref:hypothetical protein n=1 Tax=Chitinolyticbacter meiyuanensis TaxID=682798 RepID=UPI0011E59411|nr:hypothetical protein [Chitinolyticbacter meiyuanensis]
MHIIIGLLTSIAGLVWALHALQRAGLDLNALNPFTWLRRRHWAKQHAAHLGLTVRHVMDIAALALMHTAKLKGELTRETKTELISLYQSTFKTDEREARDLFDASAFKLRDDQFHRHSQTFAEQHWKQLDQAQASQILALVQRVAHLEGAATAAQQTWIAQLGGKSTAAQSGW